MPARAHSKDIQNSINPKGRRYTCLPFLGKQILTK